MVPLPTPLWFLLMQGLICCSVVLNTKQTGPGGTILTPNLLLVLKVIKGDSPGKVIKDSYFTPILALLLQSGNRT